MTSALERYPAVLLDRDGVIIKNRSDYVRSWRDVQCYPHAVDALVRLTSWPCKIVIVTNQSAVGRGLISLQEAQEINERLVESIERAGGRVDSVYMCPHAPMAQCKCRKPRPGLLLKAAEELGLDLHRSVMIGDALTDIEAGQAAGVQQTALVRTGRGQSQLHSWQRAVLPPFLIFDNLSEAFRFLVMDGGLYWPASNVPNAPSIFAPT